MIIRDLELHEATSVHEFLRANGWAHRIGSQDDFSKLITASQRKAVAINPAGHIVGFARGITDGISNGYLSMVVVAPDQRRKGIGRRLVQHVIGSNSAITWVLRASREGAVDFFSDLGFSISTVAMERPRA
jgi:ribosomal protein S18 acetylase RimI-like enzyme